MSAYVCNMPETEITNNKPFNGSFYRFVRTLHGLKAVVDIPVDNATTAQEKFTYKTKLS